VSINLTLIIQMLVFAAFVWFTMTFVWPPLMKALDERQAKIADGLAAAERGRRELELAQHHVVAQLKQAKIDASDIIEKAHRRAAQLLDEAKDDAREQVQRAGRVAAEQLALEVNQAKDVLRKQVAVLAVACAEKILKHEVNERESHLLIDHLIEEL
jgi:F-type H+-transporting ATPase subunit b